MMTAQIAEPWPAIGVEPTLDPIEIAKARGMCQIVRNGPHAREQGQQVSLGIFEREGDC